MFYYYQKGIIWIIFTLKIFASKEAFFIAENFKQKIKQKYDIVKITIVNNYVFNLYKY